MNSNDFFESMAERIIEKAAKENVSVLPLGIVAFESREQMAELFKKSLVDYSIEKLSDTEENKIVVEDINFIITRLNDQFTSTQEKDDFYQNYAQGLLGVYGELIEVKLEWDDVAENTEGEYPRIEGDTFYTRPSTTCEEATLWLFKQLEKKLKEQPKPERLDGINFYWGQPELPKFLVRKAHASGSGFDFTANNISSNPNMPQLYYA